MEKTDGAVAGERKPTPRRRSQHPCAAAIAEYVATSPAALGWHVTARVGVISVEICLKKATWWRNAPLSR